MEIELNISETNFTCEVPLDIMQFNFTVYDFPRTQQTFRPFTWVEWAKLFASTVVIFAALFGNTCVILAVAFNRTMRTTINYYLVNLAMADVLISICCMSVYLINNLTEPLFILGPVVCKLNAFAQMTCLTSSVLTLSAIACDRFIAIIYPLHARFRVTKQRTSILIFFIWIISSLVSVPFLLVREHNEIQWSNFVEPNCGERWPAVVEFDSSKMSCVISYPTKKLYYAFVTVALFFIPIGVMVTAYSLIVWKLWATELPGERNQANINVQYRAKKKVIKMVCIVLLVFAVCWAPLQLVVYYSQFIHSAHDGQLPSWFGWASYFATFLAFSNSALNPIIYGGFNQNFRNALCAVCRCRYKRNSFDPRQRASQKSTRNTVGTTVNWSPTGKGNNKQGYTSQLVDFKPTQDTTDEATGESKT